uniref:Uncharacterized protein n=1 Tax=Anguilla anguilla TaxID=7936 RepID=A0A0E9XTX1_ANGAN
MGVLLSVTEFFATIMSKLKHLLNSKNGFVTDLLPSR